MPCLEDPAPDMSGGKYFYDLDVVTINGADKVYTSSIAGDSLSLTITANADRESLRMLSSLLLPTRLTRGFLHACSDEKRHNIVAIRGCTQHIRSLCYSRALGWRSDAIDRYEEVFLAVGKWWRQRHALQNLGKLPSRSICPRNRRRGRRGQGRAMLLVGSYSHDIVFLYMHTVFHCVSA